MNILHISPTFYPATAWGGPIFSTLGLCNALAQHADVALRVLTTDAAGPALSERIDLTSVPTFQGYEVAYCRRLVGHSFSPGLLVNLRGMIDWADCVHLTGVFSAPTLPTLFWCRALGKPLVWSPRGSLMDWHGNRRPGLKEVWMKACNVLMPPKLCALHVTSETEASESLPKVAGAEAFVIRNGIDIPTKTRRGSFLDDGIARLLYIGRLHEKKGIERLIEAVNLLRKKQDARLTICGDGDDAYVGRLRSMVSALDLQDRVQFTGFVHGAEKERLLFSADVCVVPSYTENFAMVVAEALAHGLPVIASKGTPWERLSEMQSGLWVDNTAEAIATAVGEITTMPLADMGRSGRAWMEREFSWSSVAAEMLGQYRRLTNANG